MKFPHTPYLPFSPSASKKDVRESGKFDLRNFINKPIVITEKLDGSNFMMSSEKVAARNGYCANGISFDYAKAIHAEIRDRIPNGHLIFGEWLFARHSIHYEGEHALPAYFQVFAVYVEPSQTWKSWEAVKRYAKHIGCITVPEISVWPPCDNLDIIEETIALEGEDCIQARHGEGIVVRNTDSFSNDQFKFNVAKYVRANHVQTDEHWSKQPIVRNELRK